MPTIEADKLLDVFNQQLERIDEKYDSSLSKIESKLDRLMELTMAVAMLQERSTKQGGDIIDLKMELKASRDAADQVHKKLHERIDGIHKDIELVGHTSDEKIKTVDSTVKKYLYMGIGFATACGLFLSIVQFVGYDYIKTIKEDYTGVKSKIEVLVNDVRQTELNVKKQETRIDNIDGNNGSNNTHPGLVLNKNTVPQK